MTESYHRRGEEVKLLSRKNDELNETLTNKKM
jgi:hypothetical protein